MTAFRHVSIAPLRARSPPVRRSVCHETLRLGFGHACLIAMRVAAAEHEPCDASLPLPSMSVAILVVGTAGDALPFVWLAKRLHSAGHRVRIATHAEHAELMHAHGVEQFAIGGDPKTLSVASASSAGDTADELRRFKLARLSMLQTIAWTLWPGVSETDSEACGGAPFVADAIIANIPSA